jgi:hypothetical protein
MLRAFLLLIVGLAGDPEHGELFGKWSADLASAAERLGVARERIVHAGSPATRDGIARAFATLARSAGADDLVLVVLFGHGTFDGRMARFNLSGPDMTAPDFAPLLRSLPSRHVVFVNTASASGPFVDALAGPGRTVITATRSGQEQYATLFGGYFVDALNVEAADADKNRRVSVLEAFEYARREVARAYEREGLLATEHALIEDGGKVAGTLALGDAGARDASVPSDPKVRALYDERRALERRIDSLKLLKPGMDEARYLAELEQLATALALKAREIRQAEAKP